MLVIIRLNSGNRLKLYYLGLLPIKKAFIARDIEARTLPSIATLPGFATGNTVRILAIRFCWRTKAAA
jgi:hypothetical protein